MTVASSTNDARKPQWLTTPRTFLAVVFLGIVVISARDVTDPDVWWHLKTGQLIAQTRAIPHVDSFSFTRAGSPWIAHEWLTELLIYGVYQVGGWGALIVVFAVIVSAAFFLLYLRSAPNPYGSGLIVLLGAWATAPLWGVRPQMISLLLTSLWLLILERSERDRRLLWWTLPITVLWVNLHAGFALGIALVMLFLVGEFVEQFIFSGQSNSARLRTLAVTLLLDLLLIPLNPNGWKMYLYPLDTLRSKAIQTYIAEWASPNFHRAVYLPFLLLLPGITACWASSRVRVRPRDILLLLASTFAALHSIRMIPFFVLIAVPILSRSLEHWTRFSRACSDRSHASRSGSASSWLVPAGHAAWLNALILLAVAGFVGFQIRQVAHRQLRVQAEHFPSGAVAYLQAHPPTGPLFNLYDWGGYLIWKLNPRTPVFVDGRADLYGEVLLRQFADTYDLSGKWQNTLETWQICSVLVRPDSALAIALERSPGWAVRYSNPQAVLLERSKLAPP